MGKQPMSTDARREAAERMVVICAEDCTSACHASDCEHHGHLPDSYQRQVNEAVRTIKEDWPEWMRRNRDAVHQHPAGHRAGLELDAAWKRVEAVLPDMTGLALVLSGSMKGERPRPEQPTEPYSARLWRSGSVLTEGRGTTPAAALLALAKKLVTPESGSGERG